MTEPWAARLRGAGWCGYFNQGPVMETYNSIREYVDRRLLNWLMRRTGAHGRGLERFTQDYLQTAGSRPSTRSARHVYCAFGRS